MILKIEDVSCGYGLDPPIVSQISMTIRSGEIWCVLGPNGVGKTTLFKSVLGFLKLKSGRITIDGQDIRSWTQKKKAQVIGYVPQAQNNPFPFSVKDVVLMGRTSYLSELGSPGKKDVEIAERNIHMLGIGQLENKKYTELSGGERQMVLIARALTQEPDILIMDEPTSNLDFGNQVKVLKYISDLSRRGLAILMTSHFPDHAFLCSSKVALFRQHQFVIGEADNIVTEANLKQAYGVNVQIVSGTSEQGKEIKSCVPLLDD
ncbi:ABC transporter ATP-binding protein [Sporolactobacillus sp. CPB3-1]|uniref:ABC transporter ATP-binding protein n=1 Tax=Sporolactobacillus mangiferae TaxID=2940498 RepID=A0ABT0MCD9_9BACL|nr:ABC transporter ATP-binding protein [Sporolactobacillus mangiferae]MCL1632529.1 ABC transporter ATP-binding protein [Sporolactobacillus mangiferae]